MRFLRAASALLLLAVPPCYLLSQSTTTSKPSASANAKKKKKKKRSVPKPPPVSAAARAHASEDVTAMLDRTAGIPIENPAAMVPFFEQLRRRAKGESTGPLSILHYGDSHTAADEWTGSVRLLLQAQFGDGGGLYGLGGVSISTSLPRQSVYLEAECSKLEVFYLQQPGGGDLQLYDNGAEVDKISTDGPLGPGYAQYEVHGSSEGPHRFELETLRT